MNPLDHIPALDIHGEQVSLGAVFQAIDPDERQRFLRLVARDFVIAREARDMGISVSDEELQFAADQFRLERKLHKAADTHEWLEANGWNAEDLERRLERRILKERLMAEVAPQDRIEQHFAEHRREYDRVLLAHLVVSDRSVAEELLAQIHDDQTDFTELACKHSIDEATCRIGGELGLTMRTTLAPAIESAVFAATNGEVIGPFKTKHGFHLVKVQYLQFAELTLHVSQAVQSNLFETWVERQMLNAGINVRLEC